MPWSLGALSFDDLRADIVFPAEQREIETAIGRDGIAIFETGLRGEEFTVESRYAFTTYNLAMAACATYAAAFDSTPVNMVVGPYDFTGGTQFVVLGVRTRIEEMVAFYSPTRGFVSPAFVVHAVWRIIGV